MAATGTPTPNIGLRRAQGTDPASVDDINYNSALIDTKLGAVGNSSVQDQIDTLNTKITPKVIMTSRYINHSGGLILSEAYTNFNMLNIQISVQSTSGKYRSATLQLPVINIDNVVQHIVSIFEYDNNTIYHAFVQFRFSSATSIVVEGYGVSGWTFDVIPLLKIIGC